MISLKARPTTRKMGRSYKHPVIWQKSMELVAAIYRASRKFHGDQWAGLTWQLGVRLFRCQATLLKVQADYRKKVSEFS
jgi:hypothetical protein